MRPLLREREPPPPRSAAPISIYTWWRVLCRRRRRGLRPRIAISNNSHPFVYSTITIIDRYDVHYTESIILVAIIDSWKFRRCWIPLPSPLDISFGCLNIGEFHIIYITQFLQQQQQQQQVGATR